MDKQILLDKRSEAERQFEMVQKQYNDAGVELDRLRGEYRALTDLIDNYKEPEVEKQPEAAPQEATVIEAVPEGEEK